VTERTSRETNRWVGVDAVAWIALAVGLLAGEPGVVLVAVVGVALTAYARSGTPPDPTLAVARELDDPSPEPGATVTVRLTVENAGDRLLPDVRVVDGVPTGLAVVEGSPHRGTVLRAGESRTVTYAIEAARGTHAFDPVAIVCRSLDGSHETELREDAPTEITCRPSMQRGDAPPLRRLVSHHGGEVPTDRGGSGVEFHGVRAYQPGDRANRIDWARRARTGELATLQFREEWRVTAVLLVDARASAYARESADATGHAVEWCVGTAAALFAGLADAGNRVGISAIGSGFAWLAPAVGEVHRRRARDLLTSHPVLSPSPPADLTAGWGALSSPSPGVGRQTAIQLRELDVHLPGGAQVFLLSPLVDDAAVTIARRLQERAGPVTVVTPDVTGGETVGARVERLDRLRRLRTLRLADVRTVDCGPDEPLSVALERKREAWR
jgi:uncharacterized repeat protein (TIGR01451 family)